MRGFIQCTRIFVMILYTVLHRLMGLQWLKDSGPFCLEITEMRVWLRYFGISQDSKTFFTSAFTKFLHRANASKKTQCGVHQVQELYKAL